MKTAWRNKIHLIGSLVFLGAISTDATRASGTALTTESFSLPDGQGNSAAAPYMDEVVNTSPSLSTWGESGAIGLQGSQSIYPNGSGGYVNNPPSTVAFKFNVGSVVDSLNATYGVGNWTISNTTLTMQYTYYANNPVFGAGAGSFETYVVQNNSWYFSNSGSGSPGNFYGYVAGEDPTYATSAAALPPWSGGQADLGSTTYNWLSPASNPNYQGWQTDKTGPNQGLLTDILTADPLLVNDITSASTSSNPNISFYLVPNNATLGLTIFTGGGRQTPTLTFNVVSAPKPILSWNNTGGSGNGATWDTSSENWNDGSGATAYAEGSSVNFNDTNNGHYAVTLNETVSPGAVTVISTGNYTINGSGSIAGSGGLTKAGNGTLMLSTVNSYSGGTRVNAGTLIASISGALPGGGAVFINNTSVVRLATDSGLQTLSGLTIATGATFDINNDEVLINYAGPSPGSIYLPLLAASKATGWTGTGIISTAAASASGYGIAYGDGGDKGVTWLPTGQIKISYTLYGDINQDGVVNGTDFGILAANFGKSVTGGWEDGDLNYDGTVNGTDFGLLAGNFGRTATGKSIALPASQWADLDAFAAAHGLLADVPEPPSLELLSVADTGLLIAPALLRRRRLS
jgi:autotransporter-associated beta strand protein